MKEAKRSMERLTITIMLLAGLGLVIFSLAQTLGR
jgi:hypothetical protein